MSRDSLSVLVCMLGLAVPVGCGDKDGDDTADGGDGGATADGGDGGDTTPATDGGVGDGGTPDGGTTDGGAGDGGTDGGTGDGGTGDGGAEACSEEDLDGDGFSECEGDCGDDDAGVLPGADSHRQMTDGLWSTDLGTDPVDLHLADLDADGVLDAVLALAGTSTVEVRRGNGDGSFDAPSAEWEAPVVPAALATGDFDGDGAVDVAWVNMDADVVVHLGTGGGTFDATGLATRTGCGQDGGLDAGDLDGDGLDDLFLACGAVGSAVLRSTGDGTFDVDLMSEAPGSRAFVRDLDLDGDLDLLVGGGGSSAAVLWGDGSGVFGDSMSMPGSDMATGGLGLLDANGDGYTDIALLGMSYGLNAVAINEGDRAFTPAGVALIGTGDGWDAAGGLDIDEDGNEDLWMHDSAYGITVFWSDEGSFEGGASATLSFPSTGLVRDFVTADLDGDSHVDLAWAEYELGRLVTSRWRAPGVYGTHLLVDEPYTVDASAGDLDGDGDDEVLLGLSGGVAVYQWNGERLEQQALYPGVATGHGVRAVDLDGDGHLDAATWGRSNEGTPPVRLRWGDGSVTLGDETDIRPEGFSYVSQLNVGDIDGDGVLDLVLTDTLDAQIALFLGDGTRDFIASGTISLHDGSSFDSSVQTVLADLDGDGDLDLAADDYGTSTVQVFTNDGSGSFSLVWREAVGRVQTMRAVDLDGDGAMDLLVDFELGDTVAVLWGDGTGTSWTREDVGTAEAWTDDLALLDYTGEGDPDLVSCANNRVTFQLGDGLGGFGEATRLDLQSLSSTCRPLLADLAGDGVPELLVSGTEEGLVGLERACP